jgi:fumarylacetoacetate (FAA) hydrolase
VKLAHVRERNAPAGAPWRLAAGLDAVEIGLHWLDLERARRRLGTSDPGLGHNRPVFRQPVTTLDDHLARGLRIAVLGEIVERFVPRAAPGEDDAVLESDGLAFGPPLLQPASLRDFYAFEQHVRTAWERRGQPVPDAWYRLPVFYFSNVSEIRGPKEPVWAPDASRELDYELEVAALIDTPARDLSPDRAEEAIGGFTILNDWSARDLQREETTVRLGPAKGKDFATTIGPWLVTPDELEDVRERQGYGLAMTATVNGTETSRGRWSEIHYSFGDLVSQASADARLRPGDLIGSGTVGTGCLLEVGEKRLGRYLEPSDKVVLAVERLGELETPIVERQP